MPPSAEGVRVVAELVTDAAIDAASEAVNAMRGPSPRTWGGAVSVSFEGIKPGNRVRIEFAEPLAGCVEGEVFDVGRASIRLSTGVKELVFYLDLATVASITVVEPPVQEGDVVLYEDCAWTATGNGDAVAFGNGVSHSRWFQYLDVASLPPDAIWIIRGGKLNPLLAGER